MKAIRCFSIFLIVAALVVACGMSMEARLKGRWVARTGGETEQAEDPQQAEDPANQGLSGLIRGVMENAARSAEVELVLHADGTGSRTKRTFGMAQQEAGYWRVQEIDDESAGLQMTEDKDFSTFEEWTIRWVDKDHFKAEVPGFGRLTFERQPANR